MSVLKTSVVLSSLLALGACGGGGGTSSPSGATTLSGVALDGYLYRAEVCLDLNDNFLCDVNEPAAITDEQGRFTLNDVTQSQMNAHSILVNAIANVTVDQDKPGETIARSYLLTAPAGSTTISPLTTLIKAEMVLNRMDSSAAGANVINKLFYNADSNWKRLLTLNSIYSDYISNPNPALHNLAASLINRYVDFSPRPYDPNYNLDGYIRAYFGSLSHTVAEYISPNVNAIATAESTTAARAIATDAITAGSVFFPEGISEVRRLDKNWYKVSTAIHTAGSDGITSITGMDYYAIQTPRFTAQARPARDYWELTASEWVPVSSTITNSSGVWGLKGAEYGSAGVTLSVRKVDLAADSGDWPGVDTDALTPIFPSGSSGYFLSYLTKTPRYVLSGNAFAAPGLIRTLDELVAAYSSSAAPTYVNALTSQTGLTFTFTPTSATGGSLSIRDPDIPDAVAVSGGSYTYQTEGGQRLLMITAIPQDALAAVELTHPTALSDYRNGVRPFFAVAPDGNVREGVYTPASVSTSQTPLLNRTALNAVMQALSLCQFASDYSNPDCGD